MSVTVTLGLGLELRFGSSFRIVNLMYSVWPPVSVRVRVTLGFRDRVTVRVKVRVSFRIVNFMYSVWPPVSLRV